MSLFSVKIKSSHIWMGLRRSPNDQWYWERSGKQYPHAGPNRMSVWYTGQPEAGEPCSLLYFHDGNLDLNQKLHGYACVTTVVAFTLCEIPYVR